MLNTSEYLASPEASPFALPLRPFQLNIPLRKWSFPNYRCRSLSLARVGSTLSPHLSSIHRIQYPHPQIRPCGKALLPALQAPVVIRPQIDCHLRRQFRQYRPPSKSAAVNPAILEDIFATGGDLVITEQWRRDPLVRHGVMGSGHNCLGDSQLRQSVCTCTCHGIQ